MTPKELSDFYGELDQGGVEIWHKGVRVHGMSCPGLTSNPEHWQLCDIPKKPVDLAVLTVSRIDCEFSTDASDWQAMGRLLNWFVAADQSPGYSLGEKIFKYCRPRMGHWHSWAGGVCPLPKGVMVDVRHRSGDFSRNRSADSFGWHYRASDGISDGRDIIAFKVIGLSGGYCWPWALET